MTPDAAAAELRRGGVAAEPDGDDRAPGLRAAVEAERIAEALLVCRDRVGFDLLSAVTALDEGDEFVLLYHLVRDAARGGDIDLRGHLTLRVRVPRGQHPDGPVVPSAVDVYPGANLQEREIFDLMGIRFRGHPNLTRVLLWPGFRGHPLRKDYEDVDNEIPWRLAGLKGPDGALLDGVEARRAEEDASAWVPVADAWPPADSRS